MRRSYLITVAMPACAMCALTGFVGITVRQAMLLKGAKISDLHDLRPSTTRRFSALSLQTKCRKYFDLTSPALPSSEAVARN